MEEESLPYLTEEEKRKMQYCLAGIDENLVALKAESNKNHAYKYYIKEKAEKLKWDLEIILRLVDQ